MLHPDNRRPQADARGLAWAVERRKFTAVRQTDSSVAAPGMASGIRDFVMCRANSCVAAGKHLRAFAI